MQKVFRITVDISKKIPAPAFEVNTNDLKSVKLEITITNGLSLLDLTDVTPRINIRKPDNEVIFQDCEIVDATAGKVQIVLENQAYLVPGTHTAEIACYKGNEITAITGTFSYKSVKGIMNDEAVESKSEFTAINRTLNEAERILEDLRENGGGAGVDQQARQKIEEVTTQLAENERYSVSQGWIRQPKTGLIAHRGSHISAPENTLKSIQIAGELGYEAIEVDVNMTSNGEFVLMHDDTVDRTTNGTGAVRSLSYEQINSLVIDENYAGKSEDEVIKVPTLEEALQEASYYDLGVNLDCSKLTWTEAMIQRVIPLLYKYGVYTNTFFVMGDPVARNLLTSLYPDVNVTWLSTDTDPTNNINTIKKYKNGFITYSAGSITDSLISAYKAENIPVFVYDCNTLENVNKFISKGVRFVETDTIYPTEVLKR